MRLFDLPGQSGGSRVSSVQTPPPYNLIISILAGRLDSTGRMYPGSRDTMYYTARAILWIHIHATCVSKEFALNFSLQIVPCDTKSLDGAPEDLIVAWVLPPPLLGCTIPLRGLLSYTRNGLGMRFYICPGLSGMCQAHSTQLSSPMTEGTGVQFHRVWCLTAF